MLFAYLSTDDLNPTVAAAVAGRLGITLCRLDPRDGTPGAEFDALVYDWDYWPADRRGAVLGCLLAGVPARPLALHSYNVELAEALGRRGIVVATSLQPELFQALRQAVRAARVAAAMGASGVPNTAAGRAEAAA